jgi:hypothetical protein
MKIYDIEEIKYKLPNKLNKFQLKLYKNLIDWKWANITKEPGVFDGKEYDAILPQQYKDRLLPIYQPIVNIIKQHKNRFPFSEHLFIGHMASSQAACVNLFIPLLQYPSEAANVLGEIKSDLKSIATGYFDNGYRIEFWDEPDNMLNDHNKVSGTDSDIAIAYYDYEGNLNLWLIEHKLTEEGFTQCGGYKSKGKTSYHSCESIEQILDNNDLCYYNSARHYNYWKITADNPNSVSVNNLLKYKKCPFRGGMNQLWRNQLLASAIEKSSSPNWPFKKVFFSVVYHPENVYLEKTLREYESLIDKNDRFSYFTSDKIINGVKEANLQQWVTWYKSLYSV